MSDSFNLQSIYQLFFEIKDCGASCCMHFLKVLFCLSGILLSSFWVSYKSNYKELLLTITILEKN